MGVTHNLFWSRKRDVNAGPTSSGKKEVSYPRLPRERGVIGRERKNADLLASGDGSSKGNVRKSDAKPQHHSLCCWSWGETFPQDNAWEGVLETGCSNLPAGARFWGEGSTKSVPRNYRILGATQILN